MNLKGYFLRHFYGYFKKSYPYLSVIILIDLLPLYGVFWLGWSAMDAIYLYVLETLILFGVAFAKMWNAQYVFAILNQQTRAKLGTVKMPNKRLGFLSKIPIPSFSWAISGFRGLLYFLFLLLNIPFILLQVLLISLITGHGFSIFGFLDYDAGLLDLGLFSINMLHLILLLLLWEHISVYRNKFLKKEEYKNTGLVNEAINISLRVVVQQLILIGLLAITFAIDSGKSTVFLLIIIKTLLDVISFVFNRIWGGLQGKMEGKGLLQDQADIA